MDLKRIIYGEILADLTRREIGTGIIIGPRQVGKTTAFKRTVQALPKKKGQIPLF